MKKLSFLILSLPVIFFSCGENKKTEEKNDSVAVVKQQVTVEKDTVVAEQAWATDSVFKTPESVLFDKERNVLYVSNVGGMDPSKKDNNGFISKVSVDGKVENLEWVKGLNAPKGMGVYKNKLYVTDITKLVEIDIEKGKITKGYEVPGAKFLNDVFVDTAGVVYFSDSETNKIHTFQNGKVSVWKSDLQGPNGIYVMNGKLYLSSMGSKDFKSIDLASKKDSVLAMGIGAGDGVEYAGKDGYFIVSDWNGAVYMVSPGKTIKFLDTVNDKVNSADVGYIQDKKLLLVPTFFKNKVVAYTLKF